jgi:hypothetical protein
MASRDEFLLLALASASDGRLTPVQIQKAMFLLKQEAGQFVGPDFYEFVPYNYGPFNSSIYDDLNALAGAGLVTIDQSQGRSWACTPSRGRANRRRTKFDKVLHPPSEIIRRTLSLGLRAKVLQVYCARFTPSIRALRSIAFLRIDLL